MDLVTGLSKVEGSLRTIIEDEGRWELSNRWVQTVLRVARQLSDVIHQQQDELAAQMEAVRQREQAARAQVIAAITQMATERGLKVNVLSRGPAVDAQAPTAPRVEATSAEIRAWAREHHMAVGDRGIISKRIIEAYGLAHAS